MEDFLMSDTVRTWRHIQQRYNLIGTKCNTCGELFFPSRVVCPNCRRKGDLEPFQFSGKGKIYTYSVIRSAPDDFKNFIFTDIIFVPFKNYS